MYALLMVLIVLCSIGMFVGAIWVLVIAGKEGALHVVGCLLCGFYFLYYIFSRLDRTAVPASIYGVSLVLSLVFQGALVAVGTGGAVEPEDGNWFDPPIAQADADSDAAPEAGQESGAGGEMPEAEMPDESMVADSETEPEPESEPESEPSGEPPSDEPVPANAVASSDSAGEPDSSEPPSDGEPVEPSIVEPTYAEGWKGEAQRAFYQGRNEEGKRFLQAALVASDDDEVWKPVRYSAALERPITALRWGIGLQKVNRVPPQVMAMLERAQQEGGDGGGEPAPLEQPEVPGDEAGGDVGLMQPDTEDAPELREYTGDIGSRVMGTLPRGGLEKLLGPNSNGQSWGKQVEYVGVGGDLQEVISLARQRGIDVTAVAVVTIALRGRIVDASLSVRLIDVATEKRLWTSPTLNSNQVKLAISRGKDPTGELVAGVKEYLDTKFEMEERPALDKATVQERLDSLVKDDVDNPLPLLFELRYYQRQGVLTPMQAESYYKTLVGLEHATAMATGTEEQRRQILRRYLPITRD